MNQNAIYLYLLCKQLGYECDLLSYDEAHTEIVFNSIKVNLISSDPAKFNPQLYCAIITVTTSLEHPIYKKCKTYGVTVVGYICSNSLCMTIENTATAHTRSTGILGHEDAPIDKAWILDSFPFMKTYIELLRGLRGLHGAHVSRYVPHVWNSSIMEYYCKHIHGANPSALLYNPKHHTQKKITLIIPESNINFVKTCVVQLMAAEKLYNSNPDLIDEIFIFSYPMESQALNALVSKLHVGKKVRKFARLSVCEIFLHFNASNNIPVFACHQIYTPLNYSYYEIMYYGYPFVHNSPLLKDYGNYYTDLDIDMCAIQIYNAFKKHDDAFETRLAENRTYLETIDPTHVRCVERWREAFAELCP
jgi:hypothetical protein